MWNTQQSDFNIVKATPFGRDVIKELADECHAQGIRLHLYYSHLDWMRDEYPAGRTGLKIADRDTSKVDWPAYYDFMNKQLVELLTNYGEIGAIWFDGWWDHEEDATPFDWELKKQYALIHHLQPACLVGNNHHQTPFEGEDIQIFERDVPGQNKAGLSGQEISRLPLETCQTMNGIWGYKVADQNYKSTTELIRLLVQTSGKGANLLLNIGPQPDGTLPKTALSRLSDIGQWLSANGEAIYGTESGGYADGEKRFIIAPQGLNVGDKVMSGAGAEIKPGNALPLSEIPLGAKIHNIELQPGRGGQMVRSAGLSAQLMAKDGGYATLRLPSGEMRKVLDRCRATIGEIGNEENVLPGSETDAQIVEGKKRRKK